MPHHLFLFSIFSLPHSGIALRVKYDEIVNSHLILWLPLV